MYYIKGVAVISSYKLNGREVHGPARLFRRGKV